VQFTRHFRKRTGVWVSGTRSGKTRPAIIAFALFLAGTMGISWWIGGSGHTALAAALVVLTFVVGAATNHAWMVIYQRELRGS
jgi:hypothetical protein